MHAAENVSAHVRAACEKSIQVGRQIWVYRRGARIIQRLGAYCAAGDVYEGVAIGDEWFPAIEGAHC